MLLDDPIRAMSKVKLHFRLEDSSQPARPLALPRRQRLALSAARASLLPVAERQKLAAKAAVGFARLRGAQP